MKFKLQKENPSALEQYQVNAKDRIYQFWERNALSVDLWSEAVFDQKLDYIHNNPLQEKWCLAEFPEDYRYSSARVYLTGHDEFGLITQQD